MDYNELIALALQGRSVNSASKALGIPLTTFQRYVTGERVPDFDYGLRIVRAAGISLETGFLILAEKQREYRK